MSITHEYFLALFTKKLFSQEFSMLGEIVTKHGEIRPAVVPNISLNEIRESDLPMLCLHMIRNPTLIRYSNAENFETKSLVLDFSITVIEHDNAAEDIINIYDEVVCFLRVFSEIHCDIIDSMEHIFSIESKNISFLMNKGLFRNKYFLDFSVSYKFSVAVTHHLNNANEVVSVIKRESGLF